MSQEKTIGVLALQGAFSEHINMLSRIPGIQAKQVKTIRDLSQCQALILPGGESTAIALSASRNELIEPIREYIKKGNPVYGTCAGMILLAQEVLGAKEGGQEVFGGLDITVQRY